MILARRHRASHERGFDVLLRSHHDGDVHGEQGREPGGDESFERAFAFLRAGGAGGGDPAAGHLPGQLPRRGEGHRRRVHIETTHDIKGSTPAYCS